MSQPASTTVQAHPTNLNIDQGNCKKNHLTTIAPLTPKILRRYSGLQPANFLLFGTPSFSVVSAFNKFKAIFLANEKFSAA